MSKQGFCNACSSPLEERQLLISSFFVCPVCDEGEAPSVVSERDAIREETLAKCSCKTSETGAWDMCDSCLAFVGGIGA